MISFSKQSGIYKLEVSQKLNTSLEHAWNFFLNPDNISKITPSEMEFTINSVQSGQLHIGQIFTYKISIIPGFRTNWVIEITDMQEKKYFVNEQRTGPYKMWHHEHIFEEINDGVLLTDRVSYQLRCSIFGQLLHYIHIKNYLKEVFEFREKTLDIIFS